MHPVPENITMTVRDPVTIGLDRWDHFLDDIGQPDKGKTSDSPNHLIVTKVKLE